jgi:uncharacterized membrane protein
MNVKPNLIAVIPSGVEAATQWMGIREAPFFNESD